MIIDFDGSRRDWFLKRQKFPVFKNGLIGRLLYVVAGVGFRSLSLTVLEILASK